MQYEELSMDKLLAILVGLVIIVACIALRLLSVRGSELTPLGCRIAAHTRLDPATSRLLFYISGLTTVVFSYLVKPQNIQPLQLIGLCLSLLVMTISHIGVIRWRGYRDSEQS